MIEQGAGLGAVVLDEGHWWDLGSRAAYLEAHQTMHQQVETAPAISAKARVESGAVLRGLNVIGDAAVVESGAELEDCILWPGARITAGARLKRCIVRADITASGSHESADL
jgi:NDP-sugar pyrophosphorylase family protein